MHLCFIADGRSPIAQNWIRHFTPDHQVTVLSTFPVEARHLPGATVIPVPLLSGRLVSPGTAKAPRSRRGSLLAVLRSGPAVRAIDAARRWVAPVELTRHVPRVGRLLRELRPDLVHAMRIPYEGILTAQAIPPAMPLIVSVWGNDFTLHARNPLVAWLTRRTLRRADLLHADCHRDARLAVAWGYAAAPPVVLPGSGGVQLDTFYAGDATALRAELAIPADAPVVINPRGVRGYVRNDAFFQAIPQVLAAEPATVFVCTGMQGNPVALQWLHQLGIAGNVRLLPVVPRERMADLFRLAQMSVSPSIHDGTPNSLLEAMACGCLPVAGDLESVREWLVDGYNGLLIDPARPGAIAAAVVRGLGDAALRTQAQDHNRRLILARAEYTRSMQQVDAIYRIYAQPWVGAADDLQERGDALTA